MIDNRNPKIPLMSLVCCVDDEIPVNSYAILRRGLGKAFQVENEIAVCDVSTPKPAEISASSISIVTMDNTKKREKLRQVANSIQSDFVCVFDPDVVFSTNGIRQFVEGLPRDSEFSLAYGIVENNCHGELVSRLITIDKSWSHRVIRPTLLWFNLSITIPGQFYIVDRYALSSAHGEGSYLDDLEIGAYLRALGARTLRIAAVVGAEQSRQGFASLLSQRIRWMKGQYSLMKHLLADGHCSIFGLSLIHVGVYHILPVTIIVCSLVVSIYVGPLWGAFPALLWVLALSIASRGRVFTSLVYSFVFPLIHVLAGLAAFLPMSDAYLRRR